MQCEFETLPGSDLRLLVDLLWIAVERIRFGFTKNALPSVKWLFSDADDTFFHRVLINSNHVLQLVLPQQHETQYNLRARQHDRLLIPKTADLNDRDFIVRMLNKSCYTSSLTNILFY